ncbi:HalOD1 output domain-containing protein [Natronococcus pandeyae]|nr:HalOD1 output domain-containing protein [Natronococcus pandeyae]
MSVKLRETADNKWYFTITEPPPSIAVIEAIVFVSDQDSLDMEPLAEVIDPDAIDQLLCCDDTVMVSFSWQKHGVEISGSDEIVISKKEYDRSDPVSADEDVA